MAVPDPQPEPRDVQDLDASLRSVPVPEDLLPQLRRLATADGRSSRAAASPQDPCSAHAQPAPQSAGTPGDSRPPRRCGRSAWRQRLLDVPLPQGLIDRLKQIAAQPPGEAEPERAIVPFLPLRRGAARAAIRGAAPGRPAPNSGGPSSAAGLAALVDRSVESRLRDVAVPAGILSRLRSAGAVRWSGRGAAAVTAASLAIVTLVSVLAVAGRLAGLGSAAVASGPGGHAGIIELAAVRPADAPRDDLVHVTLPMDHSAAEQVADSAPSVPVDLLEVAPQLAGGASLPNDRGVSADRVLWRLDRATLLARPLGGVRGDIAELLTPPARRSAAVPDDPGFDRRFYLQAGEWPVMRLERGTSPLRVSRVALGAEPFSFDLTRQSLAAGHWPAARLLRKEEFLAGLELGGPRPTSGGLALRTAAGPAPWGDGRNLLLQVSVTAEGPRFAPRQPPVHLVAVVDVSPHMERSLRLEWARRALHDAAEALRPEDRMSIITCGADVNIVAQSAGPEQAAALHAAIDALHSEPAANPLGGLLAAYALAMSGLDAETQAMPQGTLPSGTLRRVVLLSDALHVDPPLDTGHWPGADAGLSGHVPPWLQRDLAAAAKRGLRLSALHVGTEPAAPGWRQLVDVAGGALRQSSSSGALRGAVLEALTGRSQLLGRDLQLTVTFDAQRVAAYRLIGYEPSGAPHAALESPSTGHSSALYCGQSAVVLYEVQLRPRQPAAVDSSGTTPRDELLAVAQLSWEAPSGVRRQAAQRLMMSHVAASFAESPGSLQLAALTAATAEILSGSLYMQGVSLSEVRAVLRRLSGEAAQQPACAELARLLDAALEAQRRAPRRGL